MSSFCKCESCSHFFSKNISIYAIFNDQSFNNTLTNDIISFEQLGPDVFLIILPPKVKGIWLWSLVVRLCVHRDECILVCFEIMYFNEIYSVDT